MKKEKKHGKKESGITTNRKWRLILFVVIIATIGLFAPPLLSVWLFKAVVPLVLISGTEYVSLITLVVSAYFGANVWARQVDGRNYNAWQQRGYGDTWQQQGYGNTWQQQQPNYSAWQQMDDATTTPGHQAQPAYQTPLNDDDDSGKEA